MNSCLEADPYIKKEVVIMEDNPTTRETIKQVMEEEFDWRVHVVNNKDEVVELAQKKYAGFYILDIHMGKDKPEEGLDALEEIKEIDKNVFVSIFSGYPSKRVQEKASKLDADEFRPKSPDLKKDIRFIASKMLCHMFQRTKEIQEEIADKLEKLKQEVIESLPIDFLDSEFNVEVFSDVVNLVPNEKPLDVDINILAFEKLRANEDWVRENTGFYVAFVDGKLASKDKDKTNLIHWLRSSEFRDMSTFLIKVEDETILELPSSIWLGDI
ncbi:response regulator [Nostoc sp. ChiVER01]|uniref:response regulator n=1 Tax=Nostoc sp. ChiVER01 TaxID=3075382 RepID=UPI002AD32C15|nr:response regulator [Nostoc sp. ChiVER01]MDZ8222548.1 response regulator [Nostoc sp. ChiVER01]